MKGVAVFWSNEGTAGCPESNVSGSDSALGLSRKFDHSSGFASAADGVEWHPHNVATTRRSAQHPRTLQPRRPSPMRRSLVALCNGLDLESKLTDEADRAEFGRPSD